MKEIVLTNSKLKAQVDDDDEKFINQWSWKFDKETGYAYREIKEDDGSITKRFMQNEVWDRHNSEIN